MTEHDHSTSRRADRDALGAALNAWQAPPTPPWLAARALTHMNDAESVPRWPMRKPVFALSLAASMLIGSTAGWVMPLPTDTKVTEISFTW